MNRGPGRGSSRRPWIGATLVVSLAVHIHPDAGFLAAPVETEHEVSVVIRRTSWLHPRSALRSLVLLVALLPGVHAPAVARGVIVSTMAGVWKNSQPRALTIVDGVAMLMVSLCERRSTMKNKKTTLSSLCSVAR